jgi:hypothetical protein
LYGRHETLLLTLILHYRTQRAVFPIYFLWFTDFQSGVFSWWAGWKLSKAQPFRIHTIVCCNKKVQTISPNRRTHEIDFESHRHQAWVHNMVSSALDLFPAVRKETQTMDIYDTIPHRGIMGTTAPPSCSTTSIKKKIDHVQTCIVDREICWCHLRFSLCIVEWIRSQHTFAQ